MKSQALGRLALAACGICWSTVNASTIYDEGVMGDLSNSGLSPTSITIGLGSNQVLGTTGRGANGLDRDYFSLTVPVGWTITALTVLPGTVSGGAVSFIGMESGPQVTLATNAPNASGLLGWWHYSPADINMNILPEMAIPANSSSGFTPPLGAGTYSFWVQDFNAGAFNYGFDFTVAPAPEPATYGAALLALVMLSGLALRRRLISYKCLTVTQLRC